MARGSVFASTPTRVSILASAFFLVRHKLRPRWAVLFAVASFLLYLGIGWGHLQRGLFFCESLLFDADVVRVTNDITSWNANHHRSSVHPLFPAFLLPFGVRAADALQPELASLLLVAAAGAAAVYFAACTLRTLVSERDAGVLTALYSLSASSLFMFSLVDTFAFAALGITSLAYCTRRRPRAKWIAAVFSAGMLTSNLAHVATSELIGGGGSWYQRLRRAAVLLTTTLALLVALSLLQSWSIPRTRLFFSPAALHREHHYLVDTAQDARLLLQRLLDVTSSFLGHAIAAPEPVFRRRSGFGVDTVSFAGHEGISYGWLSGAVAMVVVLLLSWSTLVNFSTGRRQPEVWGVLVSLLVHFALLLFYGQEAFLYSPLWVFHLVLWVALAFRAAALRRAWRPRTWHVAALAGAVALTNCGVAWRIFDHYTDAIPCAPQDRKCAIAFYRPKHEAELGARHDAVRKHKVSKKRQPRSKTKRNKQRQDLETRD